MALPFINSGTRKKRKQIVSVDLGGRTTKSVLLERRGDGFALCRFDLRDAPIYEKTLSSDLLAEHLKSIFQALETTAKHVALSIDVNDAVVRPVELPQIPVGDMRQVLKMSPKVYLQQDLVNYVFDCYIMPPKAGVKTADGAKTGGVPKVKVLVAGAKKQLVEDFQTGIRNAGLVDDCIVPGLIAPVNAFEMAMQQAFANDTVALVDIGFKNSSICLLNQGELVLSRVVNIGGDKFTAGLAEAMNISYAEAEGIKVGLPAEVRPALEAKVTPLGRELRASLDFFEHQQDRPVTQVYVSGGSAQSEFIMELLHNELVAECKTWNPTSFLEMALPGPQMAEIERIGPQLTVAIGTAMTAF